MRRFVFIVPGLAFIGLLALFVIGLKQNPREIPSPFIGRAAPAITLARLDDSTEVATLETMRGKVWLLNVWASWCTACRIEHPLLVELARQGTVPIVGLNYKDEDAKARAWLKEHGDPYVFSVVDSAGRVGIDYGVYGVPETFLIDERGVIRYKHIGPLTKDVWHTKMIPVVDGLRQ